MFTRFNSVFLLFMTNISQKWNNHLLRWNASHYGGIKSINVDPKMVWLPDIVLYNK